jgi:hypothetical protein
LVTENNGKQHVVDVKGVELARFKMIRQLWPAYGPLDLWIVKGSKSEVIEAAKIAR